MYNMTKEEVAESFSRVREEEEVEEEVEDVEEKEAVKLSFLHEFGRDAFEKSQSDKEAKIKKDSDDIRDQKEEDKRRKREEIEMIKESKRPARRVAKKEDEEGFSEEGSELMGKDKRILLTKVKQYRSLFPAELKGFKVKNNASPAELQKTLDEMEIIVDCSSVDNFLTDAILQSLLVIEGVSSMTQQYDVSGLAEILKDNKQFHQLCKQLYIKYNVFTNVPPEYQMIMLVATTAYVCKIKNSRLKMSVK